MKRIVKASKSNAQVGIWWYTDNKEIWQVSVPTDCGIQNHMYIHFSDSKNHLNCWSSVVKQHLTGEAADSRINKGFKSFERGRVTYNCATQCYEILCSESLVNDTEFREAVKSAFDLSGNRLEFVALHHYQVVELTGNLALDEFYYENQF